MICLYSLVYMNVTHSTQFTCLTGCITPSLSLQAFFFSVALRPNAGHGLLILEVSRSHNDVPHSIGLLWTSDQLVAETSTWQHITLTTDKHPCPGGIRTHDLRRRAAAELRLRPRGHWDRLITSIRKEKCCEPLLSISTVSLSREQEQIFFLHIQGYIWAY